MEFIVWLVITVLTVIPMMKLLPHFGYQSYWAFAAVIPFGVLVMLWLMASKVQEGDQS
ncbi:MAG: hypothetical protein AAFQ51_16665 [Pseudomonadota bacterium]